MAKNNEDYSSWDMQQAMRLARSDTAKQLYALLQSGNAGQLQSAMEQAASGDMTGAKALLEKMMADPQARTLLEKLQGDANG